MQTEDVSQCTDKYGQQLNTSSKKYYIPLHSTTEGKENCVISFESDEDMNKAFEEIIYKINGKFVGVDENSILVSKEICESLEENNIKYKHIR